MTEDNGAQNFVAYDTLYDSATGHLYLCGMGDFEGNPYPQIAKLSVDSNDPTTDMEIIGHNAYAAAYDKISACTFVDGKILAISRSANETAPLILTRFNY